jgi:anti-anti-sigma factor
MTVMETAGNTTKVALKGRLDTEGVGRLEVRFNATVCPAGKPTILEFSEVTFLSSMGIRMLVSAAKVLMRRGAKMVILAPQALVRESILGASLDQLIPVVASDEEAAQILGAV